MHPSLILNDEERMKVIKQEIPMYMENINFHFAQKLMTFKAWWPDRHMDLQLVSPFIHWITSHYFYEDLCKIQFPEIDDE